MGDVVRFIVKEHLKPFADYVSQFLEPDSAPSDQRRLRYSRGDQYIGGELFLVPSLCPTCVTVRYVDATARASDGLATERWIVLTCSDPPFEASSN